MALTQTKSIFHESYIQLFQSWTGFGVHQPLAAPGVIHIWLFQSQLIKNEEHVTRSQNDLVNSEFKRCV